MSRKTSDFAVVPASEQVDQGAIGPHRLGLVARVKQRLFPPSSTSAAFVNASEALSEHAPVVIKKNKVSFQASIAELLLVNRLKARSQRDQAAGMLELAAQIIFVTCKNWFSSTEQQPTRH